MDNFDIGEMMKKVLLAGIGAVAATAEGAQKLVEEMVKKGEVTLEQGKALNEELKHSVKSAIKDNVTVIDEKTPLDQRMELMSEDELKVIREKLNQLDSAKNASNDTQEKKEEQ